jgi:hypothetical protein
MGVGHVEDQQLVEDAQERNQDWQACRRASLMGVRKLFCTSPGKGYAPANSGISRWGGGGGLEALTKKNNDSKNIHFK